jgi:hypothetical protein
MYPFSITTYQTDEPPAAPVQRAFTGYGIGNESVELPEWDDNANLHIPGSSPLSGTYRGREEIESLAHRSRRFLAGKCYQVQLTRLFTTSHAITLSRRIQAQCQDEHYAWDETWLYALSDDQIRALWIFVKDQNAFDAFWKIACDPGVTPRTPAS